MPDARITSTQFEKYLAEAQVLALDAITAFGLFYFLTSPKQKTKYAEVLAKHKQVFSLMPPAAFSTLILSLHKLFEEARNPVSIYRCISMASQLSLISPERAKSLKSRMKSVRPVCKKVAEVRHHLVAHRDCVIPISKVFENAKVAPRDLRELTLAYWEVLNALKVETGQSPFDADRCCKLLLGDLESFMTDLLYAAKRR
jgi:hypothetical protein